MAAVFFFELRVDTTLYKIFSKNFQCCLMFILTQDVKQKIFNTMATYNDLTTSSNVVLIEFYATWCPHCQRMMPVVEQIRELIGETAKIYQLDIDENQEAADSEEVTSTPTFILYSGGREVWRYSGEIDGNVLLQKIENAASR